MKLVLLVPWDLRVLLDPEGLLVPQDLLDLLVQLVLLE